MIKSYLKTAFRFLLKNKTFSFINVFGLAVGTLCCLYILLYVQDQFGYDKHHKNPKDIYRVNTDLSLPGDKHHNASTSPPIAPAIKRDFPEVLQFTRHVGIGGKNLLKYKEQSFYEENLAYVDSTFFDVFSYHFVAGNNTPGLIAQPYSIVLLKSVSDKLFGNDNPINKVITISNQDGKHDFRVAGVVDNSMGKSVLEDHIFVTMRSGGTGQFVMDNTAWAGYNFTDSFVKLRPGADVTALEKKFPDFLNKYGAQQLKQLGMTKQLHLQPVASIHTTTGYENEPGKTVSPMLLYILAGIAIMIQLIACINFMNLSTARASKRAKEVGVRKVVGAGRRDLVKQFLGESFLLTLIGVLLALPFLYLLLPFLNQITQTNIPASFLGNGSVWLMLVAIITITGVLAGSYPAFYLSAFEAIKVMKGNFTNQISASGIRRSLVIFQFVLSIILITGIVIIYSQLNFIKNKDLGFDKNQKLVFKFYTDDQQKKMTALAADFQQLSDIKNVSMANNYLSHFVGRDHGVFLGGGSANAAIDAQNMDTDDKFIKTNGIKIISGRDFHVKDSLKTLINETLCKRLGLDPMNAPGTRLYSQYLNGPVNYVDVVGVMKDFNYNSLHGEVRPFMLFYNGDPSAFSYMTVSVSSDNYKSVLSKMQNIWQKSLSGTPFEYSFLDQEVQKQYDAEITLSKIINSFTIMAILISCLGLFGLAAFSAEQRQKEIGIRKVLGASVTGVVALLSKEFIKLVTISFIIATPIAWLAMHKWLEAFVYKVNISWWMFAISGIMSILIALATVSFQAIKAALVNPVRSLKSE